MTISKEQRHAQLQAQMTVCLDTLRGKVAAQMIDRLDAMDKRPRIKGAESLPSVSSDNRLNRNSDGMSMLGMTMGVPGMSGMAENVMDAAVELRDSQTIKRTQDAKPLSFREIIEIKDQNKQDMAMYAQLGQQLDLLDVYLASGHTQGAFIKGDLQPLERSSETAYAPKPEDKFANLNYAPKYKAAKPRWAA